MTTFTLTSDIDFKNKEDAMYSTGSYNVEDAMRTLVCDNPSMLLVLSRFGIPLGFGDKSIGKVCEEHDVDTYTFMAVVNLLITDSTPSGGGKISPLSLVRYLKNSHDYFLKYRLPAIRNKLSAALTDTEAGIAKVILQYFDQYVEEVDEHMGYEEKVVFPYVSGVCSDSYDGEKYRIDIFKDRHDSIDEVLSELKDIIIKYYPAGINYSMSDALFDIFSCSEDLVYHTKVEDLLLIPAVREAELSKYKEK